MCGGQRVILAALVGSAGMMSCISVFNFPTVVGSLTIRTLASKFACQYLWSHGSCSSLMLLSTTASNFVGEALISNVEFIIIYSSSFLKLKRSLCHLQLQ